jgi:hypothetical protein
MPTSSCSVLVCGTTLFGTLLRAAQCRDADEDHGGQTGDGEGREAPVAIARGEQLAAEPRAEDGSEAAHAGGPTDRGGTVVRGGADGDGRVDHRLGAVEEDAGEEHDQHRHGLVHVDTEQEDADGGEREPDRRDARGAEAVGGAAGDEHAHDAAEVEHDHEREGVGQLVALGAHQGGQPGGDAVHEEQAAEGGQPVQQGLEPFAAAEEGEQGVPAVGRRLLARRGGELDLEALGEGVGLVGAALGDEEAQRLGEELQQHRDEEQREDADPEGGAPTTGGVPCVWNDSMVFRPHAWPLARSASVQVIRTRPVRGEISQPAGQRVAQLDAVAAGLVDVEEERLLDGVLVRARSR